jgi:hypothetical protein
MKQITVNQDVFGAHVSRQGLAKRESFGHIDARTARFAPSGGDLDGRLRSSGAKNRKALAGV